jgi:glycosyltransferase involved in cell wall biosynthesis
MAWSLTPCAGAALAAWLFLLICRSGFWRADQRLPQEPAPILAWPEIVAVIPARNEADVIGRAIRSLLVQDYPAHFSLVLVDDHSDDGTAEIARAAAAKLGQEDRLAIISSAALPAGWTGKMWAVNQGIAEARRLRDTLHILLSDADIEHEPGNLRRLVALAETERRDLRRRTFNAYVHLGARAKP